MCSVVFRRYTVSALSREVGLLSDDGVYDGVLQDLTLFVGDPVVRVVEAGPEVCVFAGVVLQIVRVGILVEDCCKQLRGRLA